MAINFNHRSRVPTHDRGMMVAFALMGIAAAAALALLLFNSGFQINYPYVFLVPWIVALGFLLVIPTVIAYRQGKLHFAHPLVFPVFSYFIPAFVIGGFSLAFGWSQPYFLSFINDAEYNLPYSVVVVAAGFVGLSIGFYLPVGAWAGKKIESLLPDIDFNLTSYIIPSLLLFVVGILTLVFAYGLGILGFQRTEEITSYSGLIAITTLLWYQACFLLWFILFKRQKLDTLAVAIAAPLLGATLVLALWAGNKGSLLHIFMLALLAFALAGRKLKTKQAVLAGVLCVIAVAFGFTYGSTFREVKGTEAQQDIGDYSKNILLTIDRLGSTDPNAVFEGAVTLLALRLDVLSSLAVVVSNYEQLYVYEELYGLQDNISADLVSSLVPRIVWNDKPVASDARKYSDLYFGVSDNSFAITPMGDLIRNFGPAGVIIGMVVLGIIIRILYRALIEDQPTLIWRACLYFMLISTISYEGFFGTIIPLLIKTGLVSAVGVFIVLFFARRLGTGTSAPANRFVPRRARI